MKITCVDKEIGQLLKEAFYKIPRFQRPYSWDHVNVEEFWSDAVVENDGDYFIGNFVLYEDKGALGVVDGQQRLTTVTLLLCALRNALKAHGDKKLAQGLHNLIERPDINSEMFYILQTETSYPYLQEYIQKFGGKPTISQDVGPEERLLKQAFDYFTSQLSTTINSINEEQHLSEKKKKEHIQTELLKIRDRVLRLKLIFTGLENDDDAYTIFETLNTRGKDLTLSDLVKSHLSRLLKPSNKGVDTAKDKWESIHAIFEESQADLSVSTFIHHHWLSRYEYVTEKKLYKTLRRRIRKDTAAGFLDDLVLESKLYRAIYEPSYWKWKKEEYELRDALAAMQLFRIKQQIPMVLSVLRQYFDGALSLKSVRSVLRAIENFHFAFTAVTSQRSSGGISFMYALHARDLYSSAANKKASVLAELKTKLASKRPSFAEFTARFQELRYSSLISKQKALVKYILVKVYEAKSPGLAIDPTKMTLEHLSPENPAVAALSDEEIASIGNLILVTQDINNKLANKSFVEKRKILQDCNVWIDDVVKQAKKWEIQQIHDRTELLASISYDEVWDL